MKNQAALVRVLTWLSFESQEPLANGGTTYCTYFTHTHIPIASEERNGQACRYERQHDSVGIGHVSSKSRAGLVHAPCSYPEPLAYKLLADSCFVLHMQKAHMELSLAFLRMVAAIIRNGNDPERMTLFRRFQKYRLLHFLDDNILYFAIEVRVSDFPCKDKT
eukprot:128957-Amphidinium_carterae.1